MPSQSMRVLVIDDDRTWQIYLFSVLKVGFELRSAYDGQKGLDLIPEFEPDCILLDLNMPGKNGFEICSILKLNTATSSIPVIILSSKNSMQEKIQGFELGAEDYLVKSTEAEFLRAKITRAVQQYREKLNLERNLISVQTAAFEAMSGSADLGCCIRFIERTYSMHSFAQLAEGIFHTMEEFGLRVSLMFVTPAGPEFFTHGGQDISPLEKEMFIAIHDQGRFCDFGERTFCNFKWASILVKNMPLNNPERYGRIKDAVPWVMGATDSKVQLLNDTEDIIRRVDQTKAILMDTQEKLASIRSRGAEIKLSDLDDVEANVTQLDGICSSVKSVLIRELGNDTEKGGSENNEIFSSGIDFF